jgi:hypothetical protein
MTGHRTRRLWDRLRAAFGREPSRDVTPRGGYSARSQPPAVTKVLPTATSGAPDARPGTPDAQASDSGTVAAEAAAAHEAPGAGDAAVVEAPAGAPATPPNGGPTADPAPPRPDQPPPHGAAPRDATSPEVRVHEGRLDRRVAPMELSPTEALRLANDGPAGLSRRELPPDTSGGSGGDA